MTDRLIPFSPPMVSALMWSDPSIRKVETRRVKPRNIHPGDRVGVQEALFCAGNRLTYYAADRSPALRDGRFMDWTWQPRSLGARYCPRWAVRTWREVVEVRIERLGSIDDAGAVREGMAVLPFLASATIDERQWGHARHEAELVRIGTPRHSLRDAYAMAWRGLHGTWDPDMPVQVIRWEP